MPWASPLSCHLNMIVPLHDGGDTVEPVNSEQRVPFSVSAGVAVLCATLLLLFPASLAAQAGGVEVFGGTGMIRVARTTV